MLLSPFVGLFPTRCRTDDQCFHGTSIRATCRQARERKGGVGKKKKRCWQMRKLLLFSIQRRCGTVRPQSNHHYRQLKSRAAKKSYINTSLDPLEQIIISIHFFLCLIQRRPHHPLESFDLTKPFVRSDQPPCPSLINLKDHAISRIFYFQKKIPLS